ncbi:MAG: cytochrome c [Opitutus sp.]
MRLLLKIVGRILVVAVALLLVAAGFVYWKSNSLLKRSFTASVSAPKLGLSGVSLERGHHLAKTRGCLECHGPDLSGAKVVDDPAMGKLYGPNITRGKGGLKAAHTDEDFVRALRHGIGADGRGLVLMPSTDYTHLTEEDLGSLIMYVKSMPPVDRDSVPISLGPVARTLLVVGKIKLAADEIDHANVVPAVVTAAVTAEYGHYVAATCFGCHGTNLSGGKIDIGPPDWPHAANLTPHPSARPATWSEADFIKVIRTGQRPDGTTLNPVMPRAFGEMNETELKAVWAYLKTVPAFATGTR